MEEKLNAKEKSLRQSEGRELVFRRFFASEIPITRDVCSSRCYARRQRHSAA